MVAFAKVVCNLVVWIFSPCEPCLSNLKVLEIVGKPIHMILVLVRYDHQVQMPARRPANVGNNVRDVGKTEAGVRTRLITAVDENICWPPVRSWKCKEKAIAVALAIHTDVYAGGRRLHQPLRLLVRAPGRAARGLIRTRPFSSDSGLAGELCSPPACICGFSFCLGCSLGLAPGPGCL